MTTKLQFYYLELPRFQKGWEAAQTNAERWCYLFRNLYKFAGEQFEEEQLKVYLNAMVTDYEKLVIGEYHEQKGFKEGLEQGRAEGEANALAAVAKKLREIGVDEQSIRQATGLGFFPSPRLPPSPGLFLLCSWLATV